MATRRHMTVSEVAHALGVDYDTVYRMIRNGHLGAIRTEKAILVPRREVRRHIESGRTRRRK